MGICLLLNTKLSFTYCYCLISIYHCVFISSRNQKSFNNLNWHLEVSYTRGGGVYLSPCFFLHVQCCDSLVGYSICLGHLWIIHQELSYLMLHSLMESGLLSPSHPCWEIYVPFYSFTPDRQLPRCVPGVLQLLKGTSSQGKPFPQVCLPMVTEGSFRRAGTGV